MTTKTEVLENSSLLIPYVLLLFQLVVGQRSMHPKNDNNQTQEILFKSMKFMCKIFYMCKQQRLLLTVTNPVLFCKILCRFIIVTD